MKKLNITALKNKLDRIFSEYIRLRDSDRKGIIFCYCCGRPHSWKESENMHFIPRQHMSLRFDETNCHGGCTYCNHYMNGNIEAYTIHLKKDFGNDIVEKLILAKNQTVKWTVFEYEYKIKHYMEKVKKLKSEKGIK